MIRRFFSLILTALLCTPLWAALGFQVGDLSYEVLDASQNTCEVVDIDAFCNSINVPSSVEYNGKTYSVVRIGDDAFHWRSLRSITLPNSIKSIGSSAFGECTYLTEMTLPNSVTEIDENAFMGCTRLKKITLPNTLTYIPRQMLSSCDELSSITIPSSVTTIGSSAFSNCISLKSIALPEGLKKIEEWAFCNCSGISSIEISASVTEIGNFAFLDCSSLKTITNYATTPQAISDETFYGTANPTVHVIVGCKAAYQAADYWKTMTIFDDILVPHILNVSKAGYATLYLAYNVTIPAGVKVYAGTDVTNGFLNLKQLSGTVPANTGVLVQASEGKYTFGVANSATPATSVLQGVLVDTPVTAGTTLVLNVHEGEVGFYSYSGTTLHANRAYLPASIANGAKVRFDDSATGISTLTDEPAEFFIMDIEGRRQASDAKGLKVMNGKIVYLK